MYMYHGLYSQKLLNPNVIFLVQKILDINMINQVTRSSGCLPNTNICLPHITQP